MPSCGQRRRDDLIPVRVLALLALFIVFLASSAGSLRAEEPVSEELRQVRQEMAEQQRVIQQPQQPTEIQLKQFDDPAVQGTAAPPDSQTPAKPPPRKKLPNPYKDPFYNNDFSYLDDPKYVSQDLFDSLKRIRPTSHTVLDVGGEYQARFHNEYNLRLDGRANNFLLQHTRLYLDLHCDEWLRFYGEYIDATSSFEREPPRGGEENRHDAINLFVDLRLWEDESNRSLTVRAGRQEIDLGSQRLIASAPWANTRVTFDGVKLLSHGDQWDVETFWVRPVPLSQHVDNDHNFDHPDASQQLIGTFAVTKPVKDQIVNLYFLRLEE